MTFDQKSAFAARLKRIQAGQQFEHAELLGKDGVYARLCRSQVLLDLDADGDLDIVTNDLHDRPQVLISNLTERRPVRFLRVQLIGTRSNRDGLGSTVQVRHGGRAWTAGPARWSP